MTTATSLRTVHCRVAAWRLPGTDRIGSFVRHQETCLRCQATSARDRRLGRQLQSLAGITVPAPAGLATEVMQRIETAGPTVAGVPHGGPWSWLVPAVAAAGCAMAFAVARRALSAV